MGFSITITIAVRRMTSLLGGLLGQNAGRPAIAEHGSAGVTYAALAAQSAHIARHLLAGRGTLDGARIAVLLPPGAPFVANLLGIWRAGGVAVPLSAAHTAPELGHILTTAAPEATVLNPGLAARLDVAMSTAATTTAASRGGGAAWGRLIDVASLADDGGIAGSIPAGGVATSASTGEPGAPNLHDSHPALMLFTSGTTGKPKGVLLSHAGVAATLVSLHEAWRWRQEDVLLHALPLYHTHGLIVALLGALWAGAQVRFTAFNAADTWDAFANSSVFMAVPTMYVRLMEAFACAPAERRAGWVAAAGQLRLFTSGSAALPAALLRSFAQATEQTILERYGMTEIGMALGNPYHGPRVAGSVGIALPGVTVDIVRDEPDSAGIEVAALDGQHRLGAEEQPGELRVRSPQLFLGYHGDAAATAASFDRVGRFRTGDTGVRGPDGYIRLLGRTSVDILKSGGYKLSALEIEEVLRNHPAVAEVAVIGTPDPVWGDCVTACVVPRAGAVPPTLDQLQTFARKALAPYKLPRALRLLSALPRNPMGKVQKGLLK